MQKAPGHPPTAPQPSAFRQRANARPHWLGHLGLPILQNRTTPPCRMAGPHARPASRYSQAPLHRHLLTTPTGNSLLKLSARVFSPPSQLCLNLRHYHQGPLFLPRQRCITGLCLAFSQPPSPLPLPTYRLLTRPILTPATLAQKAIPILAHLTGPAT